MGEDRRRNLPQALTMEDVQPLPIATALACALFACAIAFRIGAAEAMPAHAVEIDWQTSPLDLDLRGMNGERYAFRCPPGKPQPSRVDRQRSVHGRFVDLQRRRACRRDPRQGRRRRDDRDSTRRGALRELRTQLHPLRPNPTAHGAAASSCSRRSTAATPELTGDFSCDISSSRRLLACSSPAPAPSAQSIDAYAPAPLRPPTSLAIAGRRQGPHRRKFQRASAPTRGTASRA